MTRHRTVAAITAAFGQIVEQAAAAAVGSAGVQFARPDTASTEPRVFIYLYQVTPNAAARNLDLPVRTSDGIARQRPFAALDLHYLLTFVGNEKKLEPQMMLGSVVSTLHARPLLAPEVIRNARPSLNDPVLIGEDLEVPIVDVRFTPLGLSLEDLSKVWSVFFQTPYALSVVYRASMALVEADIPILPPLPAQRPQADSGFLSHPEIAQVFSSDGQYQPITDDTTLVITGVRLRGEQTLVRVAGSDVELDQVTANRITLPVPAAARVVGVHSVRIVHRPWDASPGDAANEVQSNMISFVLHPRVTGVEGDGVTVSIGVTPAIRKEQRIEVLLDQLLVDKPVAHRLECIPFPEDAKAILQADLTGVGTGTYAVRVRVDGVTSRIELNQAGDAVKHRVVIP